MPRTKGTITGKVTDAKTGDALPGANVIVVGTTIGAATDPNGFFSILNVPVGTYSVRVDFMGYKSRTIDNVRVIIDKTTEIDFKLVEAVIVGEEVVVVGYGEQLKINLTGAVSTVSSKEMEAKPITNASQALQGQASGVWVHQNSGQPGRDEATIRIRRVGTLGNNNPSCSLTALKVHWQT